MQRSFLSSVPPIDLHPHLPRKIHEVSFSKPFYSHIGGYKLQLEIQCTTQEVLLKAHYTYKYRYTFLDSEFKVPLSATLHITTQVKDLLGTCDTRNIKVIFGKKNSDYFEFNTCFPWVCHIHVSQIEIKT